MKVSKTEIIQEAILQFTQYSIELVSTRDIINSLNISKQTFYHYFEDKKDLISETVNFTIAEGDRFVTQLQALELPPHIEIKCFFEWLRERIELFPGHYFRDLQRLYPQIYSHLYESINNLFSTFLASNVKMGCLLDMYKKNINSKILIESFTIHIQNLLRDESIVNCKRNEWANAIFLFCSNALEKEKTLLNTTFVPKEKQE